jgi:hypothetical protein
MKNIIIVILVIIVVGGVIWLLSTRTPEESTPPEEEITSFEECVIAGYTILESYPRQCQTPEGETFIEEIEDETVDWQTYKNEEYGFEIKYPPKIEDDQISVIRENAISLSYYCPPLPEPLIYNNFQIEIADNTTQLPIKTWIQQNELCGLNEDTFVDVTISGAQGVSVRGTGGCPPGGASLNRKVYLVKNSEVYAIALYHELGQSEDCAKEAEAFFEQMLSTFKFITEESGFIRVLSPNGGETWVLGESYEIRWESTEDINDVRIALNNKIISSYEYEITKSSPNNGIFKWVIPQDLSTPASDDYVIRIMGCHYNEQLKMDVCGALGDSIADSGFFSIVGE